MEYFCYLSRAKIDQLFYGISNDVDQWTEKELTERSFGSSADADFSIASIVKLFKGGITYGRKGVIQREKTIKLHYCDKLRKVLAAIAKEGPIPSLRRCFEDSSYKSTYYRYKGRFTIDSPIENKVDSDTIVTLRSKSQSYSLFLDCSLRYFSEGNEADGTFLLHSGNIRFFEGKIGMTLETVFLLLDRQELNLYGTPLFLKLNTVEQTADLGVGLAL